jgi:hypothetical protein
MLEREMEKKRGVEGAKSIIIRMFTSCIAYNASS